MTRILGASLSSVIVLVLACQPDSSGADGSAEGSSSGSGTDATTNQMTTATSNGSAEGTGSSGAPSDSSGPGDTTAEPATGTSGDTTATTDATSTGEPPGESYPACMEAEECSEPYELCWPPPEFDTPNFCTIACEEPRECPEATSGTAVPVCEGPPDAATVCVLDCSRGECPDGMDCTDILGDGALLRCTRS